MTDDLASLTPDNTFDGGDLDCGSGLVLLIRDAMQPVPEGGVLELRSREPTVRDDLPPWCRMVGHELLGELPGETPGGVRYFVRKGAGAAARAEAEALAEDKRQAQAYEWRARGRASGHLQTTVYCRNFRIDVGQPASFEESDAHPSAVEQLLAALLGDLCTSMASACARAGLELDDLEATGKLQLDNVLAHLGLEEGSPAVRSIAVKAYATTMDDAPRVRAAWDEAVARSPLVATLRAACALELKLAIV